MAIKGGQPGNTNAAKGRLFEQAIKRAIASDDGKRLRAAAEQLLDQAAAGELQAISMLADRLDGKPAQAIVGPDGGAFQFTEITRKIIRG